MPTVAASPPPSSLSTAPTSPLDPKEEEERDRLLKEQARQCLEQGGCPPCYPADPSFLVYNPPAQYRGIISYWETLVSSEAGLLCAQWKDWRTFRAFQKQNRQHYA